MDTRQGYSCGMTSDQGLDSEKKKKYVDGIGKKRKKEIVFESYHLVLKITNEQIFF